MKYIKNSEKLLTIFILPIMWILYFLFELLSGRIKDLKTIILNLSLTIIFGLVGYIIYILSCKFKDGFKSKTLFFIFTILLFLEQGIKIIIKFNFFDYYFEIIPGLLSFDPIINTKGSWLNARFNLDISFPILIIFNFVALFLFFEFYKYIKHKNGSNFWKDMCFIFIFVGALCSFIDKVFYGGSLDFIGISNLFIADIKDIYINLGLLFFIMASFKDGLFSDDSNSSLKEDFDSVKKFFKFILNDIKKTTKK